MIQLAELIAGSLEGEPKDGNQHGHTHTHTQTDTQWIDGLNTQQPWLDSISVSAYSFQLSNLLTLWYKMAIICVSL